MFVFLIPIFSFGQKKAERIITNSVFADIGEYNTYNKSLLFVATNIDSISKKIIETSIRVKNISTGDEIILKSNVLNPAIGWLDSCNVLIREGISIEGDKLFGTWKGILIRYNIFNNRKDTIESPWLTSENHVDNLYASEGKIFYTISFYGDNNLYLKALDVNTGKTNSIKLFKNLKSNDIVAFQYLPKTQEIIYMLASSEEKKEIILQSLFDEKETVIGTVTSRNNIESSAYFKDELYFLERIIEYNGDGIPNLDNSNYVIKKFNIISKETMEVFAFEKGIEVTKISPFIEGQLLVSLHTNGEKNIADKTFGFYKGGNIILGLNPESFIYILKLNN